MDILEAPAYWAQIAPDEIAIRDEDGDTTWSELMERAKAGGATLAGLGVQPGDRVGLLMKNSRQFCISALAVLAAGAILVPINYRLHPTEVREQLQDSGTRTLLHDDDFHKLAHEAATAPELQTFQPASIAIPIAPEAERLRIVRNPDDPATILYSSGTTGKPKGIVITHQSIYAMAHDRIVNDNWSRDTRTYVPYPLAFSAGLLASWMATMVAGGRIITDTVFDAGNALRRFEEDGITVFMSVPTLWQAIADHPAVSTTNVSTLKTVSAGGAILPQGLASRLRKHGILLSQGYGLTESSGVATALNPEDIDRKPGSIGRPMMRMEAKVMNLDGNPTEPGTPGELWLRGPAVMAGYWKDNAVDTSPLVDGWLATGDIVTRDNDGFFFIVDRLKDMIITGGINVFPADIERALESIPGVTECSVIGAPHDKWGETPVAFVVTTRDELTETAIQEILRTKLAGYKIPREIHIRSTALPRSVNGKILRRKLRSAAPEQTQNNIAEQSIRELLKQYFNAVNSRDWDALHATLHPSASIRHGHQFSANGRDDIVKLYRAILHQYREGAHEDRPTRILIQGNLAAVEITARVTKLDGTHITFPAADFIEIDAGLIKRVSTWYDTSVVTPLIKGTPA